MTAPPIPYPTTNAQPLRPAMPAPAVPNARIYFHEKRLQLWATTLHRIPMAVAAAEAALQPFASLLEEHDALRVAGAVVAAVLPTAGPAIPQLASAIRARLVDDSMERSHSLSESQSEKLGSMSDSAAALLVGRAVDAIREDHGGPALPGVDRFFISSIIA